MVDKRQTVAVSVNLKGGGRDVRSLEDLYFYNVIAFVKHICTCESIKKQTNFSSGYVRLSIGNLPHLSHDLMKASIVTSL